MSKSVAVAIVAVSIVFLERLIVGIAAVAAGTTSLLSVVLTAGISVLILAGIIIGHKLAWQWGRILGMLSAVMLSYATVIGLIARSEQQVKFPVIIFGSQAILLFILFFALGTEGSKKYFKLVCPKCNSTNAKAANFFFTKAKCKDCSNQW
jgi:hypothetical protein